MSSGRSNVPIVDAQSLRAFTAAAFRHGGVNQADAEIAADVLVAADLRGVESHGVARLQHYIAHLRDGVIVPEARLTVVREAPATVAFDARRGLGMVAAYRAMEACIDRARQYGTAAVTVRDSNHFGIAAPYAMMALPHDMIGVAMTNASPIVLPFGGSRPVLGTNPMAYAIPCGEEPAIVVDMATSAASYGKIEIARREGTPLPLGWALGADGQPTHDADEAHRVRALLPLGGLTEGRGYKGYALATVVEALCHALAGAAMSLQIMSVQAHGARRSNIGHFFAAYRIDGFRDIAEFKAEMDALVRTLHACPPQPGVERVLVPGEKEHLSAQRRAREGIPLHPDVVASLRMVATELELEPVV
jgi:L-2-hydroxycarboxylate dehydrogenase (NAD+)